MAAYLEDVCHILFPTRNLMNLEPEDTCRLVRYVAQVRQAPKLLSHIPELVRHIMASLPIKLRERVRSVCRNWNTIVTELRTLTEVRTSVPMDKSTIHLGSYVCIPEYIRWARTREEYLKLWGDADIIRYLPRPEFVAEMELKKIKINTESITQKIELHEWIMYLPYETFVRVKCPGFGPTRSTRLSIYNAIARALTLQSRSATLDPRKISIIHQRTLGTEVSNALSDKGRKNLDLDSSKYSELIRVASQCPAMALYNRHYQWGTIKPDDLNHPSLGKLMCRFATVESVHSIPTPEEFRTECQAFFG